MTQRRSKRIYFILYLLYFVLLMLHHILAPVFHSLAAVRFQLLPRTVYELLTGGVLWGQAGCLALSVLTAALLWRFASIGEVRFGLLLSLGSLFDLCAALLSRRRD